MRLVQSVLPATICLTTCGDKVMASTELEFSDSPQNRPFAPVDALVPITKQRLLLERAMKITTEWVNSLSEKVDLCGSNDCAIYVDELKSIIEEPGETRAKKSAISRTRRYQYDLQRLENANLQRISGSTVRAACNLYTANLRYGETYLITASPSAKSQFIRNYGGLPDVKNVISADLDLRDLYRNDVQTKIEDIQAELYRDQPDPIDLLLTLKETTTALDQWFSFISTEDAQLANSMAATMPALYRIPLNLRR